MALIQTTYTSIAAAQTALNFKADMVAQGWSVAISTDGVTYNGSGDQITTATTGAGGIDNVNVFFVLRRTGAPDWLFVRGSDSTFWLIWVSPTGAFSGGSTTSRPTAPDERVLFDDSFALFQGTPLASVEIQVEDESPYRWALWSIDTNDSRLFVASVGATAAHPLLLWSLPSIAGAEFYAESEAGAWTDVVELISQPYGGGGGGDATPPTIGTWTPASGNNHTRTQTIAVTVTDDTALEQVVITAELADGTVLAVYDGTTFVGAFAAGSTLVGNVYTIAYDAPGWPSASVEVHVLAVDTSGNSAAGSASYTITNPPAPPDAAAPTVALVSPADGSAIARTTPIVVDVTDASAFAAIFVWVVYPNGSTDVVHDGEGFAAAFGTSTRAGISGGYRYTLRRAGGWPAAPTVRVRPVDAAGNTP